MVFHFEFVLFLVQNYLDILTTKYEMGNCEKLHLKNHCKIMNGLMLKRGMLSVSAPCI